ANAAGINAFAVKPFAVCLRHRPLLSTHTPAATSAETLTVQRTSPSAFHTRTRSPDFRPRAVASAVDISTAPGAVRSWPKYELICVDIAGEISASGKSCEPGSGL